MLMKTKQTKRLEAQERQQAYNNLTLEQRIAKLQQRGHGHCKQVMVLELQVEYQNEFNY